MNEQQTDVQISGIDSSALSALIIQLNIARRNCSSYPKGHPVIDSSLQRALAIYNGLLIAQEEIIIGVTRDSLIVEDVFLDKSNLVYRDFAGTLFEHGIGALVLHPGLTIDELKNFTEILNMKREDIFIDGGIENIWKRAAISAIHVRAIRYDLFSTIEEQTVGCGGAKPSTEDLWERFARGLTRGILDHEGSAESTLEPELLATILNRQYKTVDDLKSDYAQTITDFMRQGDVFHSAAAQRTDPYYDKLATFVANLNPELRHQFLNSAFDIRTAGRESVAEEIINRFSLDTVVDILEEVNHSDIGVPPVIMGLLQRLGQHATPSHHLQDEDIPDRDDLYQKMRTIFREHASEEFIPDDYQYKLNRIIAADAIPFLGHEDLHDMMGTLATDMIEVHVSDILMLLVIDDPMSENTTNMVESLNDMCAYFLQTGDYEQVLRILLQTRNERIPAELRRNFQEHFSQPKFMEEVLIGLHIWGKTKYEQIRMIITEVGEPFIDTLLDKLAEEESMSLRHFLMARLQEFGPAAAAPITSRLSDSRWYYLRNLVLMIRTVGDVSHLERVRPLTRHPNQRVRQESLKTLLHFHDPAAEHQIFLDMESNDHDLRVAAIRLAERSSSQAVFDKVLSFLSRSGISTKEHELKSVAAQTLAEIGDVEALPHLLKVLDSRSVFHPVLHAKLKLEIVRSLERYPLHAAHPILTRLSAGKDKLAQQAALSLRIISGR
jgi:HEAT repeat protein